MIDAARHEKRKQQLAPYTERRCRFTGARPTHAQRLKIAGLRAYLEQSGLSLRANKLESIYILSDNEELATATFLP